MISLIWDHETEIKELRRRVDNLQWELSNLKERIEDIKPLTVFLKELETQQEIEDSERED